MAEFLMDAKKNKKAKIAARPFVPLAHVLFLLVSNVLYTLPVKTEFKCIKNTR